MGNSFTAAQVIEAILLPAADAGLVLAGGKGKGGGHVDWSVSATSLLTGALGGTYGLPWNQVCVDTHWFSATGRLEADPTSLPFVVSCQVSV